jgi:hypothetical protein
LEFESNVQGDMPHARFVSPKEAASWLLINEHELPTELREFEEGEESSVSRKGYRRLERTYGGESGFFINPETSREPNFQSPFSLRPVRAIIQL